MDKDFAIYALYAFAATELFKGKDIPDWISMHEDLRDKKELKKVFPKYGIKNFKEPVNIDPSNLVSRSDEHVIDVITRIKENLISAHYSLRDLSSNKEYDKFHTLKKLRDRLHPNLDEEETKAIKEEMENVQKHWLTEEEQNHKVKALVEGFNGSIDYIGKNTVQIQPNGLIKFIAPVNVSGPDGKAAVRQGESIFKSYARVKEIVDNFLKISGSNLHLPALDNSPELKRFNASNVPVTNPMVVFSSEGDEGAWDIATMSMRGISSCQSWGGEYKECLVGSIASKFVGIIYITTAARPSEYGSRMFKRSIVRFGVDTKTKKPVIIVDRMYGSYNHEVAKIFVEALQKRTQLPVLNFALHFAQKYEDTGPKEEVPPSPEGIEIPAEDFEKGSYMDTKFPYRGKKEKSYPIHIYTLLRNEMSNIMDNALQRYVRYTRLTNYNVMSSLMQTVIRNAVTDVFEKKVKNPKMALRLFYTKIFNYQPTYEDITEVVFSHDPESEKYRRYEKEAKQFWENAVRPELIHRYQIMDATLEEATKATSRF